MTGHGHALPILTRITPTRSSNNTNHRSWVTTRLPNIRLVSACSTSRGHTATKTTSPS